MIESHCMIEDKLFVPAVKLVEQNLKNSGQLIYTEEDTSETEEPSGTL